MITKVIQPKNVTQENTAEDHGNRDLRNLKFSSLECFSI